MKYIVLCVCSILVLLIVSAGYKTIAIPDPEGYSRKLLETIKKNNKEEYRKAFTVSYADLQWMVNQINTDPNASAERKSDWADRISDTSDIWEDVNRKLDNSYDKLSAWIQSEQINVNELEYKRMQFRMLYDGRRGGVYMMDEVQIIVMHKDKYYGIYVADAAYLNGKWVMGEVTDIYLLDQYFDRVEGGYGNVYAADSTVATVDTTAAAPEYYQEYVVDTIAATPSEMIKNKRKLEKKIGKYYKKIYKLEEELYVF